MADPLLPQTQIQESLSRSYLRALSARSGFITAEFDFDMAGIDMQIRAGIGMRSRALDVQLKATVNLGEQRDGAFRFRLNQRNYDILRSAGENPIVLVVLDLPRDAARWLELSDDALLLRRRAYWASLAGAPPRRGQQTVTVDIPAGNRLDLATLNALMDGDMSGGLA